MKRAVNVIASLAFVGVCALTLGVSASAPSIASACPDGDKKPSISCPDGDKKPSIASACPDGDKKPSIPCPNGDKKPSLA